jgi:hypothetical protein
MGRDARCSARFQGRRWEGRAHLETDVVLFRGDGVRVRVPFVEVSTVEANGPTLRLVWGSETLELDIGEQAEAWAERIRNPRSLMDKLGVREGLRVSVVGLDDPDVIEQLEGRGAEVRVGRAAPSSDLIFLRVDSVRDLRRLGTLRRSLVPNGGIWAVSSKGDPSIRDVDVMAAARDAGLVDVKVVRWSDTHTALKLVIPVARRG